MKAGMNGRWRRTDDHILSCASTTMVEPFKRLTAQPRTIITENTNAAETLNDIKKRFFLTVYVNMESLIIGLTASPIPSQRIWYTVDGELLLNRFISPQSEITANSWKSEFWSRSAGAKTTHTHVWATKPLCCSGHFARQIAQWMTQLTLIISRSRSLVIKPVASAFQKRQLTCPHNWPAAFGRRGYVPPTARLSAFHLEICKGDGKKADLQTKLSGSVQPGRGTRVWPVNSAREKAKLCLHTSTIYRFGVG